MTFQADEELNINIPKCVTVISIGLVDDRPTMHAVVGEGAEVGKDLHFYCKMPGDQVTMQEMQQQFRLALVNNNVEYFLFGERPLLVQAGPGPAAPASLPPGFAPGGPSPMR